MLLGTVFGTATATVKHPSLEGWRLLVVQPLLADGVSPDGDPLLVIDQLGAGIGDTVFITSDGETARETIGVEAAPVRWTTQGVAD